MDDGLADSEDAAAGPLFEEDPAGTPPPATDLPDPAAGVHSDPLAGVQYDPRAGVQSDPLAGVQSDPLAGVQSGPAAGERPLGGGGFPPPNFPPGGFPPPSYPPGDGPRFGAPPPGGWQFAPGTDGYATRYGLARPNQGRVIAGVCAAVGRATNTDPVLWRVLFAVFSLAGGLGLVLYLLGWLLIPAEGDSGSPVEALFGRGRTSTNPLVIVAATVGSAIGLSVVIGRHEFWSVAVVVGIAVALVVYGTRNGNVAGPGTMRGPVPGPMPPVPPGGPYGATPPPAARGLVDRHRTRAAVPPAVRPARPVLGAARRAATGRDCAAVPGRPRTRRRPGPRRRSRRSSAPGSA